MRIAALKIVGLLLVPVLVAGCYTYSPIEVAAVTPGMEVRARVSAATAAQFGASLGMSDARVLAGSVVDAQPDALTLRVPTVPAGTVGAREGLFQQILITRANVLELESRQLDKGRTRLAVAAGVIGAVAVVASISRGHSTGDGPVTEQPAGFDRGILRVQASSIAALWRALSHANK
ncbi:MAG: hypothetical protein JWM41_913 [Gemmatimonadetes bacterium]|nr:hypothetical protein [Gemmatimonadota bacterium]